MAPSRTTIPLSLNDAGSFEKKPSLGEMAMRLFPPAHATPGTPGDSALAALLGAGVAAYQAEPGERGAYALGGGLGVGLGNALGDLAAIPVGHYLGANAGSGAERLSKMFWSRLAGRTLGSSLGYRAGIAAVPYFQSQKEEVEKGAFEVSARHKIAAAYKLAQGVPGPATSMMGKALGGVTTAAKGIGKAVSFLPSGAGNLIGGGISAVAGGIQGAMNAPPGKRVANALAQGVASGISGALPLGASLVADPVLSHGASRLVNRMR